jgi:hypothetical protein
MIRVSGFNPSDETRHHVSFGIGILGMLVIAFGVAGGLVRFLRSEVPKGARQQR